jgi:hypothetical protein
MFEHRRAEWVGDTSVPLGRDLYESLPKSNTYRDIAAELGVKESTVRSHMKGRPVCRFCGWHFRQNSPNFV